MNCRLNLNEKVNFVIKFLFEKYPNAGCSLNYNNNFELLIAARLSARCTDKCVNNVTKVLFRKFNNPKEIVKTNLIDIKNIIKPCGLSNTKSRDIMNICKKIIINFNSEIPNDFNGLLSLNGIGRKTANLIMSEAFGVPSIVTDTHVCRVTRFLGLHKEVKPVKIELALKGIIPKEFWSFFCHSIVAHGREVCRSRVQKCEVCGLSRYCCEACV